MLIIGVFEHCIELEQALAFIEQTGILRKNIMVVPMYIDPNNPTQFTGNAHERYSKGVEIGIACATASSVIATSIGFSLALGPVFWGLVIALAGFGAGFGIYLLASKGTRRRLPKKLPDVTVIVQCSEAQSASVVETMLKYNVLTIGRVPQHPPG